MLRENSRKTAAKAWFVKTALTYLGTPYRWGGDDPSGFDCSGFVIESLKSAGLLGEYEDYTADGLYNLFKTDSNSADACIADAHIADNAASDSMAGMLMFRLAKDGHATHVVICLDRWFQIGASGGGRTTLTDSDSWTANAYVKIRPIGETGSNFRFVDPFAKM